MESIADPAFMLITCTCLLTLIDALRLPSLPPQRDVAEHFADSSCLRRTIAGTFYTRAEQPSRISAWYAANGVGVAGGGLLGYCIGQIKSTLPSWKYE